MVFGLLLVKTQAKSSKATPARPPTHPHIHPPTTLAYARTPSFMPAGVCSGIGSTMGPRAENPAEAKPTATEFATLGQALAKRWGRVPARSVEYSFARCLHCRNLGMEATLGHAARLPTL